MDVKCKNKFEVYSISFVYVSVKNDHIFLNMLLKPIGTTCTRLIIWETYHYFGSTKLCRLTFMDPYNFINCINIHFYKTSDAKTSTSTICTSRILWETDHYFGSTKLCCLTFRDPYIFIKLLMQINLVLMQKKKGANFQLKQNCWHYFISCGRFHCHNNVS